MPVKDGNKRVSITVDPDYQERLEKIMKHTKKSKKQLLELWIDQYYMAFGQKIK